MSTLWEMAAALRAEGSAGGHRPQSEGRHRQAASIDISAPERVEYWCRLLGTTPLRLCCAMEQVGADPTAVRRFLRQYRATGPHRAA